MATVGPSTPAPGVWPGTEVRGSDVRACQRDLTGFLRRHLPLFGRRECRTHAGTMVRGLLSHLDRKTAEPIAYAAGVPRKNLQWFVGIGAWDDAAVREELAAHVAEVLGHPEGVLILDPSSFPKKGTHSVGVQRQWCGRLGKLENCQLGVFLGYASPVGKALVDTRLYLPPGWADDPVRRKETHVPGGIRYQETWRIGLTLLDRRRKLLPHAWVVGDEEFGRASALRRELHKRKERYCLRIPANIRLRPIHDPDLPGPAGRSVAPFQRADVLAARLPEPRWVPVTREGTAGAIAAYAAEIRVQGHTPEKPVGPVERLLIVQTREATPEFHYGLSNAPGSVATAELAGADASRHGIEELFGHAKGHAGLAHYEVRSWAAWQHHMTLALLAAWFLEAQRVGMGGKKGHGPDHRAAGPKPSGGVAGESAAHAGADRPAGAAGAAA